MRFRFAAVLLTALCPFPALAEDISVGITSSAKPFFFQDAKGEPDGFNVELAKLLCQRMKRSCLLEPTDFPKLVTGVVEGTYQIGFGNMLKTPEREETMLFSAPIWRSTSSFIAAADLAAIDPDHARAQQRICVVHKSQQETFLQAQPGPDDHIVSRPGFAALFQALRYKQCDAALVPTANALAFLTEEAGQGFDYSGPPLQRPGLAGTVHVVLTKGRPDYLEALDKAIAEIMRDGSYRHLIARYFPFDIL